MTPRQKHPKAFTMIELLVVVGIIILLIAILLPALSGAKNAARKADTTALMTGLSNNITTYFQSFNAYPGPVPTSPNGTSPNSTSSLDNGKISGTQNLLLGLSYGMN